MRYERLALTYSAVACLAAAGLLTLRGEIVAPSVLSVAGLAFVGVRVSLEAELRELVAKSTPNRERTAAAVVAFMLVTTALGAPLGGSAPVQPAAATHECSTTQQLVTFSFGLTGYATDQLLLDGQCTESHRADAIEQLEQSDAEQTKLDIYNAMTAQKAQSDSFGAVYDNYLNDTESAAWMQAEMAIAAAYENGSSEAVAKNKARQAIADYYAVKQINLIEQWNATASATYSAHKIGENESAVDNDYVRFDSEHLQHDSQYTNGIQYLDNVTVTLVNGSDHVTKQLRGQHYFDNGVTTTKYPNSKMRVNHVGSFFNEDSARIQVQAPDSGYESLEINPNKVVARWEAIQAQSSSLQNESDVFVNQTWDAYESGEINAADVTSRNTQMFRYGNAALNGSESTYDVTAALSSLGLESPELNGTGTMLVSYQGTDYYGLVLARNAPNGSWQAGTTYNTSNITGPVLLATTVGETLELNGEFTVREITSESGEQITEVRTQKVVYKTSNTSELLSKMNQILELREEIESREVTASSGGTGSTEGLLERLAALLGVSVGATAAVLAVVALVAIRIYSP